MPAAETAPVLQDGRAGNKEAFPPGAREAFPPIEDEPWPQQSDSSPATAAQSLPGGKPQAAAATSPQQVDTLPTGAKRAQARSPVSQAQSPAPETSQPKPENLFAAIQQHWNDILQRVRREKVTTYAFLREATPLRLEGAVLVLGFHSRYALHMQTLMEEEHRKRTERILTGLCQVPLQLQAELLPEEEAPADWFGGGSGGSGI